MGADNLVDKLLDKALKMWRPCQADLDSMTLGKRLGDTADLNGKTLGELGHHEDEGDEYGKEEDDEDIKELVPIRTGDGLSIPRTGTKRKKIKREKGKKKKKKG